MSGTKTDNHNAAAKLALRRWFLDRYHGEGKDPVKVIDCCQATGLLWKQLRAEYPVETYWGLDMKPQKGRLAIDSARVVSQRGWEETVIDVDTYGLPWKHWQGILLVADHPVTVFLTIGRVMMGGNSKIEKDVLGFSGFRNVKVPVSLVGKVAEHAVDLLVRTQPVDPALKLEKIMEAPNPGGNARYIGVRIGWR